ncbi:helix-turn-helix transcriptional regulator [Gordonia sp. TBRC 11910]|uniref:Helix-turn-helix transcriptional regulator n=2 Tax=Gordonia asplenii TaxID=2725283 RepID=A0A848KWA5_9ACTN|nr:helix-turn-helix transcriptional regulator [Gordonia asplenii]
MLRRRAMHPPAVGLRGGLAAHRTAPPQLSQREREVLRMWVMTDSKTEAAQRLFLSTSTVSTHITRIRQKYDDVGRPARTKASLLVRALQDGHVRLDELD